MNPLSTNPDKSIVGQPESPLQAKLEAAEAKPIMKPGSIPEPEAKLSSRQAGVTEKLRLEKESSDPEIIIRSPSAGTDNHQAETFFLDVIHFFARSGLKEKAPLEALIASRSQHIKIPQSMASVPFLALAVSQGCSVQCIEHLLQMGANPDMAEDKGNSALSYAVQQGNVAMVQCLLDHHVEVNVPVNLDHYQHTALSMAIFMGNSIIAGLLLDHGAEINQVNESGGTALECAMLTCILSAPADTLSLLLEKGANAETPFSGAPTYLGYALKLQNTALVKQFLAHGASLDHPGYIDKLRAMLVYEVEKNNLDSVKSVLSCTGLRTEITKQLLSGPPDGSGSLLGFAVSMGNELMVAELMYYRADSAYVDSNGLTALMYACFRGHAGIVEQLLKAAPLTAILRSKRRDKNDYSALGLAVLQGHEQVLRIMLRYAQEEIHDVVHDRQGNGNLLELALKLGSPDILKVLIEFGLSVNYQHSVNKSSLLMGYAGAKNQTCARLLIDQGADVNQRDLSGNTVLMYAVAFADVELVRLLLDNGAILVRNSGGYTPLDLSMHLQSNGNPPLTRMLEIGNLLLQSGRTATRHHEEEGM